MRVVTVIDSPAQPDYMGSDWGALEVPRIVGKHVDDVRAGRIGGRNSEHRRIDAGALRYEQEPTTTKESSSASSSSRPANSAKL